MTISVIIMIMIIIIIITIIIIIIQARYCKYTSVSIKKTEIDTLKINAAHWTWYLSCWQHKMNQIYNRYICPNTEDVEMVYNESRSI